MISVQDDDCLNIIKTISSLYKSMAKPTGAPFEILLEAPSGKSENI